MASTENLKFETPKFDTALAEKYISKNSEFRSKGYEDLEKIECDNHIIVYKSRFIIEENNYSTPIKSDNFLELARKIEENADLFCQLEYLIRKFPVEDVKKYDLKLIINNLMYQSTLIEPEKSLIKYIVMNANTPLAILGTICQSLHSSVVICAVKESAPVCSLFVDLCHQVGLQDYVKLAIEVQPWNVPSENILYLDERTEIIGGCAGVVSERSDIDSAVDIFLSATTRCPWRLKRILVQESVLERFRKAIEWKAKPYQNVPENLRQRCTSAYSYEDKIFLIEFAGLLDEKSSNTIVVEAYRTVRELLSLLDSYKPFALSLWCSDVAESYEIANSSKCNIVWINDYGNFDGSPQTCQGFYSLIKKCNDSNRSQFGSAVVDKVEKLMDAWVKVDVIKRSVVVRRAFSKFQQLCSEAEGGEGSLTVGTNSDSFVHISKKFVCTGTRVPRSVLRVDAENWIHLANCLSNIVKGFGIILYSNNSIANEYTKMLYDSLVEVNAPIIWHDTPNIIIIEPDELIYDTKVVWTSYGTIFAN